MQYRLSDDLIKESGKLKYLQKKLGDCKEQVLFLTCCLNQDTSIYIFLSWIGKTSPDLQSVHNDTGHFGGVAATSRSQLSQIGWKNTHE